MTKKKIEVDPDSLDSTPFPASLPVPQREPVQLAWVQFVAKARLDRRQLPMEAVDAGPRLSMQIEERGGVFCVVPSGADIGVPGCVPMSNVAAFGVK